MTKKLCSDDACGAVFAPFVGKVIVIREGNESLSGKLSVWTADNGNEGWLVGNMDEGPWILFSGDCVERIEILPLLDLLTVWIKS